MVGARSPRLVVATAIAVWTADLVALGIKALVERPRPFEVLPTVEALMGASGYSMPSGHAATAFAGLVVVGAAVPRLLPLLAALAIAIAFSRVYVGVHYVSDVLVGAAVGALVGLAVLRIRPLRSREPALPRRPPSPPRG